MTQKEKAKKGECTKEMEIVALEENIPVKELMERIANGTVIIPANKNRPKMLVKGIGYGLRTKVNANIGTSADHCEPELEVEKAKIALTAGADTIMDLSTGGDLSLIRKKIMDVCPLPLGTVPIYELAVEAKRNGVEFASLTEDKFIDIIAKHAIEGVDFVTVHCGLTRKGLKRLKAEGRITDIVSRGGALLAIWMLENDRENPLYENFDKILEIAREHDLTLSLGDGLRPGCIADATDRAQIEELLTLGELTDRAWAKEVQVMIEGPGHVPIHQIEANVILQKRICKGAPFYVLGPLVTDIAPGYDHITSAIGGAIAAAAGADFLCYVTSAEHLKLPGVEEVREGVIAARIAAHAADIAKGIRSAWEKDAKMARFRKALDWEGQIKTSIDPERAKKIRESATLSNSRFCSMCSELCALNLINDRLKNKK